MQTQRSVSNLKWLSAKSGPLVLADRTSADVWSDEHLALARQHPEPIASLSVARDRDAIVLEGGFDTAWWPTPETGGGILVRMLWADSEERIMDAVRDVSDRAWIEDGLRFDAGTGALVLFDGSLDETRRKPLEIFCERMEFAVSTANIEPDSKTCLVAHKFSPVH